MRFVASIAVVLFATTASAHDWATNATERHADIGKAFIYTCPAGGAALGTVYGSDPYTSDSPVCVAAVHAGKLTAAAGGTVIVEIMPGQAAYTSTTKYGVTTTAWGQHGLAYTFNVKAGNAVPAPEIVRPDPAWRANATAHTAAIGKSFPYVCPAGGDINGVVYGTGTYTTDSAVCVAAVHAGKIKAATGGKVTIVITKGAKEYSSTIKNGVTSHKWGPYPVSYKFK